MLDDTGQTDGDSSGVAFKPGRGGEPWGASNSPWHMWGNTQTIRVQTQVPGVAFTAVSNQMAKINYRRPETWNWVFHTRLLQGPLMGLGDDTSVEIHYDLIIGIGRSNIQMPDFVVLTYAWQGPGQPPLGRALYSTTATGMSSFFDDGVVPPTIVNNNIDRFVAQDIQCSVRVIAASFSIAPIAVETSAHFSPESHVRPDWFMSKAGATVQFPGAEIGGT